MLPDTPSMTQLSQVISQAAAPAFLLGAVASFLAVLMTRMSRIVDRSRLLSSIADNHVAKAHLKADIPRLKRRARLVSRAIFSVVASGIFTTLLLIMAFVNAFFQIAHEQGVGILFIVALGFFAFALVSMALEARIALHDLDFEHHA